MEALQERRRLILVGLVVVVLICLVGVLIFRIFFDNDDVARTTPTPTTAPTEGPTVIITPAEEEQTPTPTRVVAEDSTPEATGEPTTEPTAEPTDTPTPVPPTPTSPSSQVDSGGPVPQIEELLENGDFEEGFGEQGVARGWQTFKNDSIIVAYSAESPGPLVHSGDSAQRISLAEATQPDRYGGIYQQIEVLPNQTYTLTLNGQIRTGFGDIDLSSYGYRLQYAIDQRGGDNWQRIPAEDWVELPWDEQSLAASDLKFLEYTTDIETRSDEITLFIRAWNKWADPGLAEYTLDDLSLVGLSPAGGTPPGSGETLVDGGLPTTGIGDSAGVIGDGRFWVAVALLALLAAGAIYRGKWGY